MLNLLDYIVVLENVIPDKLCDDIVELAETSGKFYPATVGMEARLDTSVRNCDVFNLTPEEPDIPALQTELDAQVFEGVSNVIDKYLDGFPLCKISKDSGYLVLRYNEGGFYSEHTDSMTGGVFFRSISCSIALNDDFEGGEFGFFGAKHKYVAPKGGAVLFPSNFMYPHEILPVTKGTRYSIITWLV